MSEVQSVIFSTRETRKTMPYTPATARGWLRRRGLKPIKKVDRTRTTLRYRIQPPTRFVRFRTKRVQPGISLVLGFRK